jgi:anti-anti-sigma factor
MQVKLANTEAGIFTIQFEGDITHIDLATGIDPLTNLLGPGVFSAKVIFNMERAGFIDSSGLGWLIGCHKKFKELKGGMVLVNVPPVIRDMLSLMKLNRVLTIAEDAEKAKVLLA